MRGAIVCAVCLFLWGAASVAQAKGSAPRERAKALFREANGLFKRGMYLDALAKYRAARAIYPSHKIDLNIGATLDALGRRTEAAAYFERFLVQSSDAPEAIINAAKARLGELKMVLCSVKVTTLVDGATLFIDGKGVGTTPLEIPVYLDPGRHELRLEHEGYVSSKRLLELAAGQHESIDLHLKAASTQTTTTRPVAPPPPTVDHEAEQRRRSKTLWAYGLLGTGAALAVTAGVLYGVGASQGSSAHDKYGKATDPDEMERHYQDVESARTKLTAGHVLIGCAAAAVGASVYFFLTRPSMEQRAAPGVSLAPAPIPGGGLVRLDGQF